MIYHPSTVSGWSSSVWILCVEPILSCVNAIPLKRIYHHHSVDSEYGFASILDYGWQQLADEYWRLWPVASLGAAV